MTIENGGVAVEQDIRDLRYGKCEAAPVVVVAAAPASPQPPKRDEQLERLVDVVQRAVVELEMMTRALMIVNDTMASLKTSGVQVPQ